MTELHLTDEQRTGLIQAIEEEMDLGGSAEGVLIQVEDFLQREVPDHG